MSDKRYTTHKFTAEAVVVGCLFSIAIGFIVGLAAGLIIQSAGVGVAVFAVMTFFSMDVFFRGTNE